jgi:hypothetical protein
MAKSKAFYGALFAGQLHEGEAAGRHRRARILLRPAGRQGSRRASRRSVWPPDRGVVANAARLAATRDQVATVADVIDGRRERTATVGVAEHVNAAVLVTLADGELLDRRRIELTEPGLPSHPHHHEGSWAVGRYLNTPGARALPLADALALVERVRASAARCAHEGLEALAASLPVPISRIAIRACPTLPPTTEERIIDNRAQTIADSVMYREALAAAAEARGWAVHWYDRDDVLREAAAALRREDIDAVLFAMGRSAGPPWQAKHKLAAAAAMAAGARPR